MNTSLGNFADDFLSLSRFASWDWVEKGFNLQLIIILLKSCVWVGGGCERERGRHQILGVRL